MNPAQVDGKRGLHTLYLEDQRERKRVFGIHGTKAVDKKEIRTLGRNDEKRLNMLRAYLRSHALKTSRDFYAAAILLQHGKKSADYKKAHAYAKTSAKLGYPPALWLTAATMDRHLKSLGRKQKYGTQFYQNKNNRWKIWPFLEKTTDEERKKYGVEPLKKLLYFVKKLNSAV